MSKLKAIESPSDFARWRAAIGLNGQQVSTAAEKIGVTGATKATQLNKGHNEPSLTERLAMAAVRAGLPAWTPETDGEIAALADLRRLLDQAVERRTEQSDAHRKPSS